MIQKARSLILAIAILPLQATQAHNWLPIETQKFKLSNDIKKTALNESLIIITDPIAEAINIRFVAVKDETYVVHLINETGNEVSRQYRFLAEGENSIEIKTQNVPVGSYHIKIDNEFQTEMGKLFVQK
jgi:hypothetical protein